ncbi:hypothetical protein [Alistipes shahii]
MTNVTSAPENIVACTAATASTRIRVKSSSYSSRKKSSHSTSVKASEK